MRIVTLDKSDRGGWASALAALDEGMRYPLGDDRFAIDHGADYFAFFDRLGDSQHVLAVEDGRVLATAAGILRHVPRARGRVLAWYGCDLKVVAEARGRHIPLRMLVSAFPIAVLRCRRGYGISMDPPQGENPVVRLLERFALVPLRRVARLLFFSLDATAMCEVAPLVSRAVGPIGYRSLAGTKDIVLESTGRPMPLWHVQHGPFADPQRADPVDGGVHMFCVLDDAPLVTELHRAGIEPNASASIIAHGLHGVRYDFVLTSDI